jgi:hypothetical protein
MYNNYIVEKIKGRLVFDIGSNRGTFSRSYTKAGAKVIAVEPIKFLIDQNTENYMNVVVENMCISDHDGYVSFCCSKKDPSMSSCCPEWRQTHRKAKGKLMEVKCNTLDFLINKYGVPAYIKIDVEGYENVVLKTLKTAADMISIEYTVGYLINFTECMDIFKKLGYRTFVMAERINQKKDEIRFYFKSVDECIRHFKEHPSITSRGDLLAILDDMDISVLDSKW